MYVCMYVCMCSRPLVYVCMYVCMYTDDSNHAKKTFKFMHVCMYVCMVGIAVSVGREGGLQSIGSSVLPELRDEDGNRRRCYHTSTRQW